MTLKQRRIELPQNTSHKPRVFLLLLNEQLNRGLIRRITRLGRLLSKVRALTAFPDLEPLKRANQRRARAGGEFDRTFPRDFATMTAVVLKVIEPVLHFVPPGLSLGLQIVSGGKSKVCVG